MNQHYYSRTTTTALDLSGDLVSHPPDSEDLSGFLISQPRQNRSIAKVSKTVQHYDRDEDLSGCLTSGFLTRPKSTPQVNRQTLPTERASVNEIQIDEDKSSGWLYLD
jgi:hypothetical protein